MRKVLVAVIGACVLAFCLFTQVVSAESIAVCSPEGGDCALSAEGSLEDAVNAAAPGSVIQLGNGVYEAINIQIKNNITIRGTDPRLTILQPSALPCTDASRVVTTTERVFEVIGMQLNLEDLTIRNGCAFAETTEAAGGGIWASGVVNLRRVIMQDNAAKVLSAKGPGYAKGGAIYNGGLLTIEGSTIITNSAIANDTGALGAGIFNNGIATLINNTIAANLAMDPDGPGATHYGGGIFSSGALLTAEYNTIVNNFAGTNGGGLWSIGPVRLANNLFHANTSPGGSAADCGAPNPPVQATGQTQLSAPEPCPIEQPPVVRLTPITTDTIVPVYRPSSETITRSDSIDFGRCDASQVKLDQLGNPRGFGGKCDLGAVDAAMSFMPLLGSAPAKPDLRIRSVTIDPPPGQITAGTKVMITVVVENVGNLATTGRFYVDMAINPQVTPANQAGHTWMDFCKGPGCEGVIWNAPPTITDSGGSFPLLTDLDNIYVVRISSQFDRFLPAGPVNIWVYADSYDSKLSPTGLIDEIDETNNQYHYPTFTVKPGRILPTAADQQLTAAGQPPVGRPVPPTYER